MYKNRQGNLNVRFTGYNPTTTSGAEDLEENLALMNQEISNPLQVLKELANKHLDLVRKNKIQ